MPSKLLVLTAFTILFSAACHKTAPVASKSIPPAPAPVATTPATRPAATPQRPAAPTQTARQTTPARPATMTQQERETLNQSLSRLSDALFDYDRANIRSDAEKALSTDVTVVKTILNNYPNQKLLIEGGADERGSAEYNLILGDKRAHAAEHFLTNMGIPEPQLTVVSYGKERPVCSDHSEECWQKNRRAHITAAP